MPLSIQQSTIVTRRVEALMIGNGIIGLSGFIGLLDEYCTTFTPDTKAT